MKNICALVDKLDEQEAVQELIVLFEPKIKSLSSSLPIDDQGDVEQELRIHMLKAIKRFDTSNTPGFWDFLDSIHKDTADP